MTLGFQPSLLDHDTVATPVTRALDGLERTGLGRGAWIDELSGWIAGADDLFAALAALIPWRSETREMYEQTVAVPRLVHTYGIGEDLPHPALVEARDALSRHYADELGEPFATAGCCYYRDGQDSVAWHGDTLGRGRRVDTMVAIISLGSPRKLSLRPRGGGPVISRSLGHGDLLVMGGSCQRTWEHAVLKTSKAVGPRVSIQFRPRNVF